MVAQAAREAGVGHLVHMSAIGAQDNPNYAYLYSKWQGEQAVMSSGLAYTIIRPSILFGVGDEFINHPGRSDQGLSSDSRGGTGEGPPSARIR